MTQRRVMHLRGGVTQLCTSEGNDTEKIGNGGRGGKMIQNVPEKRQ